MTQGYAYGNTAVASVLATQSVRRTAETLIHEVTHVLGVGGSQKAEAIAFAREAMHARSSLTFADLRKIVQHVKDFYPELPWRKHPGGGGF